MARAIFESLRSVTGNSVSQPVFGFTDRLGTFLNRSWLEFEGVGGTIGCMKRIFQLVALACLFACPALAQDSCGQSSYGKCFNFHGRFAVYTGDSQVVLWPVGTHRVLRVMSGLELPCKLLDDCSNIQTVGDYFVFGDFVVCPLEKDTPGAMRSVCIKSARNLRRVKRK